MSTKFCGNCGNKMEQGQKFCGSCGWSLETMTTPLDKDNINPEKSIEPKKEQPKKEEAKKEEAKKEEAKKEEAKLNNNNIKKQEPNKTEYQNIPWKEQQKPKKRVPTVAIIIIVIAICIVGYLVLNNNSNTKTQYPTQQSFEITTEELTGIYTGETKVTNIENIDKAEFSEEDVAELYKMEKEKSACILEIDEQYVVFSFILNGEEMPAPAMEYSLANGVIEATMEMAEGTYEFKGELGNYNDKTTLEGTYLFSFPGAEGKLVSVEFTFISLKYK